MHIKRKENVQAAPQSPFPLPTRGGSAWFRCVEADYSLSAHLYVSPSPTPPTLSPLKINPDLTDHPILFIRRVCGKMEGRRRHKGPNDDGVETPRKSERDQAGDGANEGRRQRPQARQRLPPLHPHGQRPRSPCVAVVRGRTRGGELELELELGRDWDWG